MIVLPVEVLKEWNPFEHVVWLDMEDPISQQEVAEAISENRFRKEHKHITRKHHIERIAWLVVNGWEDSIEIEVGVPHLGCYVDWIVTDGNHRLAAAIYRRDVNIKAEIGGDLDYAEELFQIPGLADSLILVFQHYADKKGIPYICDSYDPHHGLFWMTELIGGKPNLNNRRNVSEQQIYRDYRRVEGYG